MSRTTELGPLAACLALASGRPLGPTLRELSEKRASLAARELDRGDQDGALRRLGLPRELVRVAGWWPEASAAGLIRLGRVPDGQRLRLGLWQLVGYLFLAALFVQVLGTVCGHFVEPVMTRALHELGQPVWFVKGARTAVILAWAGALVVLLPAVLSLRGELPFLGRHRRRACHAALCAALAETNAPAEVRRRADAAFGLDTSTRSVAELDALSAEHEARSSRSDDLVLSTLRLVGPGLLALAAAFLTASVYFALAVLTP